MDMDVIRKAVVVLVYGVLLGTSGPAFLISVFLVLTGGGIGD